LTEAGYDVIVVVYRDGGYGGHDIGDGVHIACPGKKPVTRIRSSHQVDHGSLGIIEKPFAGGSHRAAYTGGNANAVLDNTRGTAYHTGNQGQRNQEYADPSHVIPHFHKIARL
jgi:hypothetical protein